MERVCIYAGSNPGLDPAYAEAAAGLGALLARRGIGVVYGGGKVGLMGAVADAALAAGGEVVGVMPQELIDREIGHPGLSGMHIVGSMHERKAMMAELLGRLHRAPGRRGHARGADRDVHLAAARHAPQAVRRAQRRRLLRPARRVVRPRREEGFVREQHRASLHVEADPEALLARFEGWEAPTVKKWIEPGVGGAAHTLAVRRAACRCSPSPRCAPWARSPRSPPTRPCT